MRELDACGIGFVADRHGRVTRSIITAALAGLAGVRHRGAVAADARTSDGVGLLTPLPPAVYGAGNGVAMLFVRSDLPGARAAVEDLAREEQLTVAGWRTAPTDDTVLGDTARASRPQIVEAVLTAGPDMADDDARERAAYRLRRRITLGLPGVYPVSCSFRTIVHKGLIVGERLAEFYTDLSRDDYAGAFAIFHQRFSTNTAPSWERSQPFRLLCHNGEINTIEGNGNRMRGRGRLGTEDAGLGPEELFQPLFDPEDSDSGRLDETVELLVRAGRRIDHAMAMVVPEAWELVRDLDPAVRGFYEYHSALIEPWDGPAGIVFTDGRTIGARLDRNGLRPLRFAICQDGLVVCCSEMGAVDLDGHGAVTRGRLGPGHMLLVDPERGVVDDRAAKTELGSLAPFAQWAADGFAALGGGEPIHPPDEIARLQVTHGFTKEEMAMVLKPMVDDAHEPTFAMGDDSPLPNLAGRPRPIAHFLRQQFAQVTNPPIDPLRERLVMSTRVLLGPRPTLLAEHRAAAQLIELASFLIYPTVLISLANPALNPFTTAYVDATFPVDDGPAGLAVGIAELVERADAEVRAGAGILIVDHGSVTPARAPIPSLLATGAIHNHLTAVGRRGDTSLVVMSDDARDVHGVAALVGYGADAVSPRLALETVAAEADRSSDGEISTEAQARLMAALEAGVLKVLSKMGISAIDSYRGAALFEVIGLADEVVDACFTGTPSAVGGIGWEALGEDVLAAHERAGWAGADDPPELESPGFYRDRRGGEPHAHSKDMVEGLNALTLSAEPPRPERRSGRAGAAAASEQRARIRVGGEPAGNGRARRRVVDLAPDGNGDAADEAGDDRAVREMAAAHLLQRAIAGESFELYEQFARSVDERSPIELHDLLELRPPAGDPVPLDEVEPASAIAARFSTGAMSHGSLSAEAHENLARAMNLIGGRSNCGEGGEDPARFATRGAGRNDRNSKIKQVASGRFGVTAEYLAHADEIQIKMAQGSKPGEGGQLPGHKVTREIARLRHTQPGVGLISPPPHHDIYSIEDLAQLVYDLKQVNAAQVSVKLVAGQNVGTIAAGVAKALADVVHLSGANGGTGASPLSSIKHAGMPWEIGLADVQRTLVENGLRDRVRVRVDGGFKTGRQVITAALMGADEYSFGTAAMIAEGCIMLRACHRDTCKPGVATQRPHLRANFRGTPEGVAAYFLFVAEDVRRYLARLGARTLDEVIGRVELLDQRAAGDDRIDALDLQPLISPPPRPVAPSAGGDVTETARRFVSRVEMQDPRSDLGDRLLADAYRPIWDRERIELSYDIANTDRTVGAALAGALALEFGSAPPPGQAVVHLRGSAGQSFGAFLGPGIELHLTGEANDYVGKGMAGGLVAIRPPADDPTSEPHAALSTPAPVLAGNTCLYGATGGALLLAGAAGERFAVRNSGATAVVESVGDHCCEYMTGGTVVVLGTLGYNIGAGMTGGELFVWDPEIERLTTRVNTDLVEVARPDHDAFDTLRWLVQRHVEITGSARGTVLLAEWHARLDQLWHILPRDRQRLISQETAQRVTTA